MANSNNNNNFVTIDDGISDFTGGKVKCTAYAVAFN